ncbi:MAG: hypothetical protein A2268_12310 [Candidatus Raymondbacteria bacterium RifOxyA12_full_50_37]|uniref:Uncharacterized protein n=1 Tax=Candidatus Raymondbacteria bacterium RIFOXYD12_FULL_49_13 TaxID=1817890 RepID=A0A1F7F8K7_UNCRA|nr:MAG: hypothetical protein A2350_20460 [Candidatus Raymondbacteria bacterium RifOxyB12_full_50_8]OGJ90257.1 MAG: hypothetical protein A2268_12310 [Candidatus Raymondbacteria bacterium RifOxyA12_full_50_37]OGJ91325.1 MAG: hypothetical protein A2248_03805 [Candidatus Raymondbacteria bacterium RIFOXYA2_FULL_49_16]OGJ97770.1 MAG: hypothetical protein A2453_13915 [Candidatus Raymondbacteria bacterium RIFOXYC2_FULL_50_21]OGK02918.1 MAG: hypothetical protein A2519_06205 [Candidatus Raymondbacteria b
MKKTINKKIIFLFAMGLYTLAAGQSYFYLEKEMVGTTIGHRGKYAAIPRNENTGVHALVLSKGNIFYGGTQAMTGRSAWLFEGDVEKKDVYKVSCLKDKISGQSIITCLEYDAATSTVYGSTRNLRQGVWLPEFDFQEVTTNYSRDANKEKDVRPPAGHLFTFTSIEKVIDLGVAQEGEGVYSFVLYKPVNAIYGITDHWKLFKFDLKTKKSKIFVDLSPEDPVDGRSRFRFFGEKLIVDNKGNIWGTGLNGQFFTIDVQKDSMQYHEVFLPSIRGREQIGGVQSWVLASDGTIYGGTRADGILFSFDPEKKTCKNFGKPNYSSGMPGISVNKFGLLYMLAGTRDDKVHFMGFDLNGHNYIDFGIPHFNVPAASYWWRAYQLGPCFLYKDSVLVIGEDDRDGHVLFVATERKLPKQQRLQE